MKKILLAIVGLVILGVAVIVFLTLHSFNAENYKSQLIAHIKELTGREVTCDNETSLSWKPMPTFVLNNLTIANQDGSQTPTMFSVKQIQVEIEWASFFKKPLVVKRVILKNPNLLVERLHTYQTNFSFPLLFNPSQSFDNESFLNSIKKSVRIDRIEIQNGALTYHNALSDHVWVLHQLTGSGTVKSLNGPFEFQGTFDWDEHPIGINLQTDELVVSQPLNMRVSLQDENTQTNTDIVATLSMGAKPEWLTLNGYFSSESPNLFAQRFLNTKLNEQEKIAGNFSVEINPTNNVLRKLILAQGNEGQKLSCSINYTPDNQTGKDKLSVVVNHLDLSVWQNVVQKMVPNQFNTKIPDADVDIKIDELLWHNQALQNLLIQGQIKDSVMQATVDIQLPYDGKINLNTIWQIPQEKLSADITLDTQNLRSFIQWFMPDETITLPKLGLLSGQLTGKVELSKGEKTLTIQDGKVDEIQVMGTVKLLPEENQLKLDVKDLDVDTYYPDLPTVTGQDIQSHILQFLSSLTAPKKKWQMDITASPITLLGQKLDTAGLKAKWQSNTVDIDRLLIQKAEQLDLNLSGRVLGIGTENLNYDTLLCHFNIPMWAEMLSKLQIQNNYLTALERPEGTLMYSGNKEAGSFELKLKDADFQLDAQGNLARQGQEILETSMHIQHSNFVDLMSIVFPKQKWNPKLNEKVDIQTLFSMNSDLFKWANTHITLGNSQFMTTGSYNKPDQRAKVEIQADDLDFGLILPSGDEFYRENRRPLNWVVDSNLKMDMEVRAQRFIYDQLRGQDLSATAVLNNQRLTLKNFNGLIGTQQAGSLSVDGWVDLKDEVTLNGHISADRILLNSSVFHFPQYTLNSGVLSGELNFQSQGQSLADLFSNAIGQGKILLQNIVLEGLDASAWLSAIQGALAQEQATDGFSARLQYALTSGKTTLPPLDAPVQLKDGFITLTDVNAQNDLVQIKNGQINWSLVAESSKVKLPIILTAVSQLPPVLLDLSHNSYSMQSTTFEKSFYDEVSMKNRQTAQAKQLKSLRESELKNQQIRQSAQMILQQTEQTLTQLQERNALRSGIQDTALDELNYTAREIRELAVKTNLLESEYTALLEKTKLWAKQVEDLKNLYARQDLLAEKAKMQQLSPITDNYLADIERMYQQHPQSVLLAEIVVNVRKVVAQIKQDESALKTAQDGQVVQTIIARIQSNIDKVQKAHQYAQKIHISQSGGNVM